MNSKKKGKTWMRTFAWMTLVCPYNWVFYPIFSRHCCSVDPCVLSVLLVAVIRLSGYISVLCSRRYINVSTLSSILTCPLPASLLDTCMSISPLGCMVLCIVISFLVIWSIHWSSVLSTLRMVPSILQPNFSCLWWDFWYVVGFE